jgi:hypothetical protein
MELQKSIKQMLGKYPHWTEAANWQFWNVIWGLSPLWMGFIIFLLCKKKPMLIDFSDKGEFLIYSAAMLASALYIVLKDYKTSKFPYRRVLGMISIITMLVTVILFTGITAATTSRLSFFDISREFVRSTSYMTYMMSIILAFILTALDNRRTRIDIIEERGSQLKALEHDFDKVGG